MPTVSPDAARVVFEAVKRSAKAVEALGEAFMRDDLHELTEDELVAVVEDYLEAQERLETARTARGVIAPPGWPGA